MLMIKNKLAPSPIHGLGVFSEEFVPAGGIVWQWHEGIDQKISPAVVEALPSVCQDIFKRYGWVENGEYIICIDNEKYINHSDNPNCIFTEDGNTAIAARDIHIGDEITQDYKTFDDKFGLKEFGYDW
jgi:SET domain-containing protein